MTMSAGSPSQCEYIIATVSRAYRGNTDPMEITCSDYTPTSRQSSRVPMAESHSTACP